jgi:hypothetical protein
MTIAAQTTKWFTGLADACNHLCQFRDGMHNWWQVRARSAAAQAAGSLSQAPAAALSDAHMQVVYIAAAAGGAYLSASMGQVPGQGSGASITATASSACSPWRALVEVAGVGVAHAFVGGLLMMLGSRIAGGKAAPRGHSCRQSCSRLLAVVQWSRRLHKRPWPQRYGYPGHQLLHRRACPVRLWPAVPLDVLIWLNDRSLLRFAGGMAVRPFLP